MEQENLNPHDQIPYEPVPEYIPVTPPPIPEYKFPEQAPADPLPQMNYPAEQPSPYGAPVQQPVYNEPVQQPIFSAPVQQPIFSAPVQQNAYTAPAAQDPYGNGSAYGVPPVPPAGETPKKKNKWVLPVVLGGVALLGVLVAVFFLFLNPNKTKSPEDEIVGKWYSVAGSVDDNFSALSGFDLELRKDRTGKWSTTKKSYSITNFSYSRTDDDGDVWYGITFSELGSATLVHIKESDRLFLVFSNSSIGTMTVVFERG